MPSSLLFDSAETFFRDTFDRDIVRRGSHGEWLEDPWCAIRDLGLLAALSASSGDHSGIETAEAADLLRLVGYFAIPLPVGETMIADAILANAGLDIAAGIHVMVPPTTTELKLTHDVHGWAAEGQARRVPWGRKAGVIILAAGAGSDSYIAAIPTDECEISLGENLAGEPRDNISFRTRIPEQGIRRFDHAAAMLHASGAAMRTIMIAGAVQRLLEMSVGFAAEHKQFGRPIAKFQAIQQNLAVLAGQAALCRAAADLASQSLFAPDSMVPIAMAKSHAGEAGAQAAHIAHQVHGAISFTEEYDLQLFSRRIWAWRDEFGNEAHWNEVVGQACLEGPGSVWELITHHGGSA